MDVFIIAPIRDDVDAILGDAALAQRFRHQLTDHHIRLGRSQGGVTHLGKRATKSSFYERHAQSYSYFGINVL